MGYVCSWICKAHPQDKTRPVARDATRWLMSCGFVDAIERRYNTVRFVTITHTPLGWQHQNINPTLDSQKAPICHPHGRGLNCLLWEFGRKCLRYKGITLYITWPYYTSASMYFHLVEIVTTSVKHVIPMIFETQCFTVLNIKPVYTEFRVRSGSVIAIYK